MLKSLTLVRRALSFLVTKTPQMHSRAFQIGQDSRYRPWALSRCSDIVRRQFGLPGMYVLSSESLASE